MRAFEVVYVERAYDKTVIAIAASASSAIRKVARKFKVSEQQIKSCVVISERFAI
jgi:hypothetical protein